MIITKANGEVESYDSQKIVQSLERAGATPEVIQEVLSEIEKELYDGIHTKKLYRIVFKKLKKLSHHTAGKYHLKKGMMELGPSGFPFEKFIAALLEVEGYQTLTNQIVQGHCVKHEVDVIADKDDKRIMIECKFHHIAGNICDVKIALYVYARFHDVEKTWLDIPCQIQKKYQGWLVTNTRLSKDAEQYAECMGMGIISWNYPKGSSLRERIDRGGLYPITCLTTLSRYEKMRLLDHKVVLCQTVYERPKVLSALGLPEAKKNKVLEEVKAICKKI